MPREAILVQAFVEMADTLVADFDVVDVLSALTHRCVEALDVSAAGLMLAGADGNLQVMASSDETARMLELFQLQAQEGPCLDCYRNGAPVINEDLAAGRWPRFGPEALRVNLRSVHALPMRLRGTVIGALNLFHHDVGDMAGADAEAAQALADVATIAILQHRAAAETQLLAQQLQVALDSRVLIEQAKGMVAATEGIDVNDAFALLRGHARGNQRRLVEVADDVLAGRLDAAALHRPSA